jgi:SAM-dependent methyltransferase
VAVPPAYLRMLIAGTTSLDGFLDSGRDAAQQIRAVLAEAGTDVDRCDAVLDLECGCARVARWWPSDTRTEWHGCDFNPRLVGWCAAELPFLRISRNPLEAPTTYRDGRFDASYAISVFTHWPEPLQHAWMRELTRMLAPGGRLLFTIYGDAPARAVLEGDELERFERGEFVVRFDEDPGSNLCSAFHPVAWTREKLTAGLGDPRTPPRRAARPRRSGRLGRHSAPVDWRPDDDPAPTPRRGRRARLLGAQHRAQPGSA